MILEGYNIISIILENLKNRKLKGKKEEVELYFQNAPRACQPTVM